MLSRSSIDASRNAPKYTATSAASLSFTSDHGSVPVLTDSVPIVDGCVNCFPYRAFWEGRLDAVAR